MIFSLDDNTSIYTMQFFSIIEQLDYGMHIEEANTIH
jgi:hypothetical protein